MDKGKILFNEKCSICNYEIKHYKKRSNLNFEDCSDMSDKYLKKLHVVFENGDELIGVDAFIYVWKRTNGYGWLAKFISAPVIYQCAKIAYSCIAFLLFWRFKIVQKFN
jgi:predicted DCC family thiol-disulfide oxidoreductase YuxK